MKRGTPASRSRFPRRPPGRHRGARRKQGPRALTTAGGRLSREVFGFAPYWELSNEATWNYALLSTVAYFGITLNGDGSLNKTDAGWTGWNSQDLVDLINRAHAANDRVVLVIKTFNDATINQIVSSPANSQNAINNTLALIASKSLDGVNVDFEGGVSATYPNIQSQFTSFVSQLTAQLHQHWVGAVASVDTYSGSASWDNGFFNITALAPVTDAIFIMAYDMSSSNTPGQASPNAPLNGWTYNDTSSVNQYLAKAPASKIILGVPYYGYKWSTATNQPYAATSGGATADTYSLIPGDLACAQNLPHRLGYDRAVALGLLVEPLGQRSLRGKPQQLARTLFRRRPRPGVEIRPGQRGQPAGHGHVGPRLRLRLH